MACCPPLSASILVLTAVFAAAGCAGSTPSETRCETNADCDGVRVCLDGRCQAAALMDGGGDTSTLPTDSGADSVSGDAGGDASCGSEPSPFDYQPPNILLVFDRSCSMRRRLDDASVFGTGPDDPRTRWYVARNAALSLIETYESRVFWGVMAFPDPTEGCGMAVTAEVAPGPGNRVAIQDVLLSERIQPFGLCGLDNSDMTTQPRETPTFSALDSASMFPELMDATRDNFVILLTDGGASCMGPSTLGALARTLVSRGIPVAVVGFSAPEDELSLEAIASNGGLPRPTGAPSYYQAESRADLDSIFDEIAARVVSCELSLTMTPPNPAAIFVTVDGVDLPEDPAVGWSYDSSTNAITLSGSACDRLRRGDIRRIGISFGCASSSCVPQEEVCNGLDDDCDDAVDEECRI